MSLEQSQASSLLKQLIKYVPNAVCIMDEQYRHMFVSDRFISDYRVEDPDIIGKLHYDVFPELPEKWREAHRRAMAGQVVDGEEETFNRIDGRVDYTSWQCRPWYRLDGTIGGIMLYTEVITNRKLAERGFQEQLIFMELLLNISTEFLAIDSSSFDQKINNMLCLTGNFFDVDRAYLFRYSLDKQTMSNTHEWCASGIEPAIQRMQFVATDKMTWCNQQVMQKKVIHIPDVNELPATAQAEKLEFQAQKIKSLLFVPIVIGDDVIGFYGFDAVRQNQSWNDKRKNYLLVLANALAEVFTKINVEQKIIQTNLDLQGAVEEAQKLAIIAEEASEAKSDFLANMSHEVRTPMNAMLGMLEVLIEQEQSRDKLDMITTIKRNGDKLLDIIKDMLDISRIEAGKVTVRCDFFSPWQTVVEIKNTMQMLANNKKISLDINTKNEQIKQLLIKSDQEKVHQILLNLTSNAVKFTNEGSVTIEVEMHAAEVVFVVMDTGIGISDQDKERIFNAFEQSETGARRLYGGTGLGLAIAKSLAEAVGGSIILESELGVGSMFKFSLPLLERKYSSAADINKYMNQPKQEVKYNEIGSNKIILLAEDNLDNRKLIQIFLNKQPVTIDVAEDGQQAVELFKQNKKYDLILMDIQMPIKDGLQATKEIREFEKANGLDRTKIAALTAYAMQSDKEKTKMAGCDLHICKPIKKKVLFDLIEGL